MADTAMGIKPGKTVFMQPDSREQDWMTGINGPGYSSFGAGEPFLKPLEAQQKQDKSFLDSWASRSAIWGTRHGLGESLDRYWGLHRPAISSSLSSQLAEMGIDVFDGQDTGPLTYSSILKLHSDSVSWKNLSWKSFKDTVNKNTEPFRNQVRGASIKDFFQDVRGKAYLKETLWEGNIKPFKELLSGSKQNLCMNLGYTAGVGFSGASVVKTGVQHYRHWHEKEDGSFSSRCQTAYETLKATSQKAIQAFASWEAASVGMTVGRALLPIGSIPIGGILIGALFATTVYKAVGNLFPALSRLDSSNK